MKFKKIILSAAILAATGSAYAGDLSAIKAGGSAERKVVKPSNMIDRLIASGQVQVLGSKKVEYISPEGGERYLTAYGVKTKDGQKVVAFTDGPFLFIGALFNEKGENLSQKLSEELIPKKDLGGVVSQLTKENVALIEEGSNKEDVSEIYVFSEPVCPACKGFSQSIQPLVDQGKVKVNWVLVPFLSDQSPAKIEALLTSKHPDKALKDNYRKLHGHSGGIQPAKSVSKETMKKINRGLELMKEAEISGTPGIIVKKDGKWQLWDRKTIQDILNSK